MRLSDWVRYLADESLLSQQLVGVQPSKLKAVLAEFWRRYRHLEPSHPVFQRADIALDRLIPYYTHTDEGRTVRDSALWILSVHGVIGRGTASFLKAGRHKAPVHRNSLGLNYVGSTWGTHCLIATMMKSVTSHPGAMDKLLQAFAEDAKALYNDGFTSETGEQMWMVHFACKGDLPALAKVANMTRTFSHAPKAMSTRNPSRGVCWLCSAGQEHDPITGRQAYPYEDLTPTPCWETTMFQEAAWQTSPTILEGLDLNEAQQMAFFQTDLFHNLHLGVLKSFTSSAIVSFVEASPSLECLASFGSVESKFQELTRLYQEFCRNRNVRPYLSELSRDTMCWPMSSACPAAKWNKGQATAEVARFVDWFCKEFVSGKVDDAKLNSIAAAVSAINISMTFLYQNGLFIRAAHAKQLSQWLFVFLGHYACCAEICLRERKRRFPLYTKAHMLAHAALLLRRSSERAPWALSPLATACQMQEDFIGKPSKVSRRINVRQAHRNILWRCLIKTKFSLIAAAQDMRGMDAYPGA
ncbi:Uncharacterized protein SCF082_LOCUS51463 [Durusdinium trenchii]